MRPLKLFRSSVLTWLRRPAVWGPLVVLALVVSSSLALARLVIAPAILASDEYTVPPPVRRVQKRVLKTPDAGRPVRSATANQNPFTEPLVQISLVKRERSAPRRSRRTRRHVRAHRPMPDVVYRAPRDAPSFAAPPVIETDRADEPQEPVPDRSSGADGTDAEGTDRV